MYVDCHTHLDFFDERVDEALKQIEKYKILTVANSMDEESYRKNKEYAKTCKYVIPTFGIHPWKAGKWEGELESLLPFIEESIMIGEIGLDTVWAEDPENYDRQKEVFLFLLKESMKRNKWITLHTKGAEEEIYELLKQKEYNKVIIHWYSGSLETFEKYKELGCYFTISVDYGYSEITKQLAHRIPIDRLLVETDGPTALEWVNGTYGYPKEIVTVVEKMAKDKKISNDELKEIILHNFYQLMDDCGINLTI